MRNGPAGDRKRCAEHEKSNVVCRLMTRTFTHVVDSENLVIDHSFNEIEDAQPQTIQPAKARPLAAQRHSFPRRHSIQTPTTTTSHANAWKSPSASVLSSNPATVVFGWLCSLESR
jgi:hypothetical protein